MARTFARIGLALIGVAVAAIALAVEAGIEPLLPSEGADACFAGAFDGKTALAFGRPHIAAGPPAPIERLALQLTRTGERSDPRSSYRFDRRYNFALTADVRGYGRLRGGGQCDATEDALSRVQPGLVCFIDCDGGAITLWRVPVRRALFVHWGAGDYLRMDACGEPGEILSAPGAGRMFQVEAVPCAEPPR